MMIETILGGKKDHQIIENIRNVIITGTQA
jgi:hypothetical protein